MSSNEGYGVVLILPNDADRWTVLKPQRKSEWMGPSTPSYGGRIEWHLTGRLHDGFPKWKGVFQHRDDLDAFAAELYNDTLHLPYNRALWRLPVPNWSPDLFEFPLIYCATVVTILPGPSGSNQTYTVPGDFDPGNNNVQGLGPGGAGSNGVAANFGGAGGGGGAWAKSVNLNISGNITYRIGAGGTNTGSNDTWFNSAAFPASGQAMGARGGSGGNGPLTVGAGGLASNCYTIGTGAAANNGGDGGQQTNTGGTGRAGGGGGGSAGPSGAGSVGASIGLDTGAAGGAGDNSTASGGAANSGAGGSNTAFDATHGAGGGGGGASYNGGAGKNGGSGGLYGGGSGGSDIDSGTQVAGRDGIIVVTYIQFTFTSTWFRGFDTPQRIVITRPYN